MTPLWLRAWQLAEGFAFATLALFGLVFGLVGTLCWYLRLRSKRWFNRRKRATKEMIDVWRPRPHPDVPDPLCVCGHPVSDHVEHDPGWCLECVCKMFTEAKDER